MKHIKVGDLMTDEVVSVVTSTPFQDVAKLLAQHDISGLPVLVRLTCQFEGVVGVVPRLTARVDDSPLTAPPRSSLLGMPW
ncbi:CBS domain-containing protein [Streptomyces sp. NBC_01343]|uniref:CBS domain-containing protein n=1 Tax=Streptomyces sp. NBC_01343 TaxID=2903832 RepID=UPI002E0F3F77|nr:CBS domain-containing protein [Streptomyces sp. NBC_01343]